MAQPTGEKGQVGLVSIGNYINDLRQSELLMPKHLCTFEQMKEDSAVANSLDIRSFLCTLAMAEGQFKPKESRKSKRIADFLNHNIRNMKVGSWYQAMKDANLDLLYGFIPLNIVVERSSFGKYKGNYVLKKLSPRHPKSVQGWVWDDNFRELLGFIQKPMVKQLRIANQEYLGNITYSNIQMNSDYTYFEMKDVILFSYNSNLNNPQGNPPLAQCFNSYLEKKVIEAYELSGVSKDLGGIVVARSPSELFEKASDPSKYPEEAKIKKEFEDDLAAIHASEQTFIHLSSDKDERGNYLQDFELKGIQGGGKQYNTSDIIKEKTLAIYNSFGTQSLLLGQNSVGSNALSKDQSTILQYYVERDISEKADVINTQLARRLLEVNNIHVDNEDMPVFDPLNPFKLSMDEAGKFIQRVASVTKLTPELYGSILDDLGYEYGGEEALKLLDYTSKGDSRSGDGMSKGSGNGTSDNVAGTDNSANNADNAS